MHTIEEIKKNQECFFDDIVSCLKKDLKETKDELIKLNPKSKDILKLKEQFQKKISKFKLVPELEKYFVSEKNKEPKFYAMWDEDIQEVKIYKFNNEKRKKKHENDSD